MARIIKILKITLPVPLLIETREILAREQLNSTDLNVHKYYKILI